MGKRRKQCFQRLTCQGTSAFVIDSCGHHYGQLCSFGTLGAVYGIECRFGIQSVKNRFNDEQVRSSVNQSFCLGEIGICQCVEIYRTESRTIDVGREGQCFGGGTHTSCDIHLTFRLQSSRPGDACAFLVQSVYELPALVLCL